MMRKSLKTSILVFFTYFCFIGTVQASATQAEIPNPTGFEQIGAMISQASGLVTPFAILGFIGSVIYAGFVKMTAAGNAEKEAKSMKIATAAAVGFAIIALAPVIVRVVANLLNINLTLVNY